MSDFPYYLHERAEESRHNESMGLLVTAIGSIFLVGGLLQTIGTMERLQISLSSINQVWSSTFGFLGFSFMILGITMFLVGLILAAHYAAHRSWYGNALKEKYKIDEAELKTQKKTQGKQV